MTPEFTARLRAILAQHGHAIQAVGGDATTFGFSYSVGLSAGGAAKELYTIGLPPSVAQPLLNTLAERLAGADGVPDQITDVASVPLRLREIPTASLDEPLSVFRLVDLPVPDTVIQMIWPCAAGHWPGDPGYSHACPQDPTNLAIPPRH